MYIKPKNNRTILKQVVESEKVIYHLCLCMLVTMKSTVTSPMSWFIINFTRHWCFKNHPKWREKTAWPWPQQKFS